MTTAEGPDAMRLAIYTGKTATDLPARLKLKWNHASRNHIDPSGRRIGAYAVLGHTVIAVMWGEPARRFNVTRRLRRRYTKARTGSGPIS